jgi:hypothetical protein
MQNENYGRIIDITKAFSPAVPGQKANTSTSNRDGRALIMEPRTIRHQERVEDLFYLLFRRTGC